MIGFEGYVQGLVRRDGYVRRGIDIFLEEIRNVEQKTVSVQRNRVKEIFSRWNHGLVEGTVAFRHLNERAESAHRRI